jgi:multicomponent Na+:H+ antiporter subunit E
MSRLLQDTSITGSGDRNNSSLLRRFFEARFWATFLLMAPAWLILSGQFDPFHLSLGVLCCGMVALFSADLLFPQLKLKFRPGLPLRFLGYIPWLIYQIVLANIHVLKLCFHPRLDRVLEPHLIRFESKLESDMALVTFANSITLTPGTITVRVTPQGELIVHAIDAKSGQMEGLRAMEARVDQTFGQEQSRIGTDR